MRHVPCVVLKVVMGPVVGKRCVPSVFLKGVMSVMFWKYICSMCGSKSSDDS